MPHLISNIPHFKCWVRREFTANHQQYHGEFLHAIAFAVNTIPDRSLSFQVVFTGCEREYDDWDEGNIHGGAMWARMPIQGLIADIPLDEWAIPMEDHLCQPWDCESRDHSVIVMDRVSSSPWLCKIDGKFYTGKYMFTVDYTNNAIADAIITLSFSESRPMPSPVFISSKVIPPFLLTCINEDPSDKVTSLVIILFCSFFVFALPSSFVFY